MDGLERYIDHTLLSPVAGASDIRRLCREAEEHGFYAVCVNSRFVPLAKRELGSCGVKIAAVAGFPLGAMCTEAKVAEAEYCCREGADEIDMVMAYGLLKEGDEQGVLRDIQAVVRAAASHGAIVKVILETAALSDEEIISACHIAQAAGAAFVKTSTGFGEGGATVHAVKLMRRASGPNMRIKASGGIRDRKAALEMIAAGADRIGSSAGIAICRQDAE